MGGISAMLKQAASNEGKLIAKEVEKRVEQKEKTETAPVLAEETINEVADTVSEHTEPASEEVTAHEEHSASSAETSKQPRKTTQKKSVSSDNKKSASTGKPLGRRPNSEKNIENRKQYSITFHPSTYEKASQLAMEEDIPFAKYVERAVLEYMKNH